MMNTSRHTRVRNGKTFGQPGLRVLLACVLLVIISACASTQSNNPDELSESEKAAEFNTSLGLEYMNRGQYEVALGKLKKAIREDPDYAPAHTVMAVLYERLGEDEFAGRHYKEAYESDPEDGDVNNNYGVFLCKSGEKDKAINHFLKALDDPFYSSPYVALTNAGSCALGEGEIAQAEGYLRSALKIEPGFPDTLMAMAMLNFEKKSYLTARAFIQRYESVATHGAESLLLAYQIETALGDDDSADGYRRALTGGFPDSEQAGELRRTTRR